MSFFDAARQHSALMEDLPTTTELTDEDLIHVTGAWGGHHGHQGRHEHEHEHHGHREHEHEHHGHREHERNEHHGHQGHRGHNRCDRDDRRHHECN